MRGAASILVAVAVAATTLAAPPAASAGAGCPRPGAVSVRQAGTGKLRVTWRPSAAVRAGRPSFRVVRGRDVVGQTRRTTMVVRVVPGRRVTIGVGVVGPGGTAPRCVVRRRVRAAAPGEVPAPAGLRLRVLGSARVALIWERAAGARRYRVTRDGATVGQTAATTLEVAVIPGRSHAFTVRGVGAGDRLGRASAALRFAAGTRGPGRPAGLRAPIVTSGAVRLEWQAAPAGSAPVRGYRVLRDGRTVGQVRATQIDVSGMAGDRAHLFEVAAVDSRGTLGPAATLEVRTRPPVQTTGDLHAFVLASTDASFEALQRSYERVGVVYPTYFDCSAADPSAVAGQGDPLLTQWSRERGLQVLPRFNCQRPQVFRRFFADPEARARLLDRLVQTVVDHDFDGLSLDIEAGAPGDRDGLSAFVADLAARLHAVGRKLAVCASPKFRDDPNHPRSTFFDYRRLAQHADWVFVMAWGLHWQTSGPGAMAPADWLAKVADYVAAQPQPDRFVFGLPLYGFDWPAGGGPANPAVARGFDEIQALIARTGARPVRDPVSGESSFRYVDEQGVGHEVWFADGPSVAARLQIAADRGIRALGLWRLGQEDQALWTQPLLGG